MKILLAHVVHSPGIREWYEEIAGMAEPDLKVDCFCVTINPPGPRLRWNQLDELWKKKDRALMQLYKELLEAASNYDVLINYNGANIHPDFLPYLPTFNVFSCFDDPESSHDLSAPVASSYDAVFYGNVASRFQYQSWGCKNLAWLPNITPPSDIPSKNEHETLFKKDRDVEIVFIGEKNRWRKNRLEALQEAFPRARCHGNNWKNGKISNQTLNNLYRRAKIGWNVHNSTGPINRRLFVLPAYGVLQICDNKTGLAQVFKLNEEIIGFDTLPEVIELTSYYLEHERERLEIAYQGYHRFWQDYHCEAIWNRIHKQLDEWLADRIKERKSEIPLTLFSKPSRQIFDSAKDISERITRRAKRTYRLLRSYGNTSSAQSHSINSHPFDERAYLGESVVAYHENAEMMEVNMAQQRLAAGDPLDWPNILALNWAITTLIRDAERIVEIGSGTGPFAEYASFDPRRIIHCFEKDDFARHKAIDLRSRSNVHYYNNYEDNLEDSYDLLISVEVIEHVQDINGFLTFCSNLAPRAIVTTPNRAVIRSPVDIGPPKYPPHVREFTPGEIYWLLKQYYRQVYLYFMPDVYVPWLQPMTLATHGTPIIAECVGPTGN